MSASGYVVPDCHCAGAVISQRPVWRRSHDTINAIVRQRFQHAQSIASDDSVWLNLRFHLSEFLLFASWSILSTSQ